MLILYRKNKLRGMKKEEGADENKQSGMRNRVRVKRFKHGGIVKRKIHGEV
jgi:hypothetical protein